MILRLAALMILGLSVAGANAAQREHKRGKVRGDLPPVLKLALESLPKLRYSGTRVVEFRDGPDQKRHTEVVIRDGQRSRVEFPEGSPFAGQIIVEVGDKRMHYFPNLREIHVLPARREEVFGRLIRMLGEDDRGPKFKVSMAAGQPVAGKRTEQVVITDPRGNVAQRMFIEPRTGLILKRQLFDHVGTPVGHFEFTKVNISPRIDPAVFRINVKGARTIQPEDMARRFAAEHRMVNTILPPEEGYRLEHARIVRMDGPPVLALMYGGAKGRLTIFQLSEGVDPNRLKRLSRGNFQTHTWQASGRTFVIVGEANIEELKRLAKRLILR